MVPARRERALSGDSAIRARPIGELADFVSSTEFDVIIVGGGGSGAAAAIEAMERGASVIVLEKTSSLGGSTQESGGSVRLIDDAESAVEHYWTLTQGTTPRSVMEAFVDGLLELPDWIEAHDGELVLVPNHNYTRWVFPARRPGTAFPHVPGASGLGRRAHLAPMSPDRPRGAAMWDFLSRNLARLDVPVFTGTRVIKLIEEGPSRAVVGVEVEVPDGTIQIRSKRGVILCCGGFAYDPEMIRQYFGIPLPALSPPGRNAGDGIRMAQQVGADLWHMSGASTTVGYKFPELNAGFHCRMPDYGFVMVDQNAKRYTSETHLENHAAHLIMITQDTITGEFTRIPSFVIFDEVTRKAGLLASLDSGENRHYPWSDDNSAEVEKGWILKANTLEEIGELLGLPVLELRATIDDFNQCKDNEVADRLGRLPEQMRAIRESPFYGVPVYPSFVNTQGGPRRNSEAAILRPDGSLIPGLYGAGELGSIWNRLYPGAGNVSECLVFGRIAGRSAMSKRPEV
jgi:succinate dehydrogenase/fumarate reductase flavoprotein subunit